MPLGQNQIAPDPFIGEEPADLAPDPVVSPAETPPPDPTPTPEIAPPDAPAHDPHAAGEEGERPAQKYPSWSELKAARKERDALQARMDQMEATMHRLTAPPPEFPPAPPDKDEDPIGFLEWQNEQLQRNQTETAQRMQMKELQDNIRYQEQSFQRQTPDYFDALNFLRERELERARLLTNGNEQISEAILAAREQMLINAVLQRGGSVPEIAYAIAKSEGWRGAAPAAPAAPQVGPSPQQARQLQQQLSASSLGALPGGPGRSKVISRDQVELLTDADMDKLDAEAPGWQEFIE